MAKTDYYEMLGVARDTDASELKRAYRKKAMQYHPDRNPGDQDAEQKFKELSEAYDVLRDPEKRAAYDRFGHAAFEGGGFGGQQSGADFAHSFSDIFDDLFGEFMGGRRGPRGGPARGDDLRYNLEITLDDAFIGKQVQITVPTTVACGSCAGSGAKPGTSPVQCTACQGAGRVRMQQGFFMIERTCPQCGGQGQVISDPCDDCSGRGVMHEDKTLSVNIPAGVEDGTRIRLTAEGAAGARGGPAGDLYIFLSIAPHPIFDRDGRDLHCRVPIPMTSAALGGTVEVPTIDGGRAKVNIPAGTQNGRQFRLKGKGMPQLRGGVFGDLYIQTQVEVPVNLTKRQKELLQEFEKAGDGHSQSNNPESEGFLGKVKEFWSDLTD
ncbi:molecular chaperone DnaJ [Minwuia thermotolerans]|uniref:Chaperone protein DnaJ n=1 Tax=Minwuia thermotolerans TaxID=2056226 RepID=A0A2M9G161_9PROT|nr:molecular chaperone DnaJ [Minwuia thermotolerans]PJK29458.1 molecular chaperone DnaJ [Minwuia thermotolerans]